jgi:hypothetical protein
MRDKLAPMSSDFRSVGPGGIGFLDSDDLGREYDGNLFMGGSRDFLEGGHLFRIELTRNRRAVDTDDPALADGVADNVAKWEGLRARA